MDSSGKQPGDTSSDLDWAALVKEMEKIKDRVEQTLEPGAKSTELVADPVPDVQAASTEYAPMEEMLSGVGREEINADAASGAKLGPQAHAFGPSAHVIQLGSVKPVSMPTASAGDVPESALSLAVVGALKLRLELTRQSQTVQIHLEEAQLRVELSDGTQFRIPLNKAA
jgi:hypothetical protein